MRSRHLDGLTNSLLPTRRCDSAPPGHEFYGNQHTGGEGGGGSDHPKLAAAKVKEAAAKEAWTRASAAEKAAHEEHRKQWAKPQSENWLAATKASSAAALKAMETSKAAYKEYTKARSNVAKLSKPASEKPATQKEAVKPAQAKPEAPKSAPKPASTPKPEAPKAEAPKPVSLPPKLPMPEHSEFRRQGGESNSEHRERVREALNESRANFHKASEAVSAARGEAKAQAESHYNHANAHLQAMRSIAKYYI